jgi:HlyD family secretion protein
MRAANRQPLVLLTLLVVASGGLLTGCGLFSSSSESSDEDSSRRIFALGHLRPADGIISIGAIPGERLLQLDPDVQVNQLAPADGILGLLASYDLGKAQLDALMMKQAMTVKKRASQLQLIKAQRAQAVAAKAEAEAKQAELPLQQEKLMLLEEASQIAQAEHQRLVDLSLEDPELVNFHQLDKQRNEMDLAIQEHKIAKQRVVAANIAAEKAIAAADENIAVADLNESQLKEGFDADAIAQEIAIAKETLKRSVLLAPNVSGSELDNVLEIECTREHQDDDNSHSSPERPYTVLKVFLRPGEFITQSPIVQLADLREMVCIAEVHEGDVKEIEGGMKVTIRSPSFSGVLADGDKDPETGIRPGGMRGTVDQIGAIIAPPGLTNRNPLAPADRKVVEVRITIDEPEAIAHARRLVDLQVTIEFDKKSKPITTAGSGKNDGDANP